MLFQYGIKEIQRAIDPIIEMDDWISPDYWPEWNIDYFDGTRITVQAPTSQDAKQIAGTQYTCSFFAVNDLPSGALSRYERDIGIKSYVIQKQGCVPDMLYDSPETSGLLEIRLH